ncbi:hypothetical protein D3C86_1113700 [compost metagenome]
MRYFKPKNTEVVPAVFLPKLLPVFFAFALIAVTSWEMKHEQRHDLLYNLNADYDVTKGKWVNEQVFKIETPQKLTYIKTPSHKPLICWTGDGYKIIESKVITQEKEKVWFNIMEKDGVLYKSYWWYECGSKKYTSFVEVMLMKLIYNKPIRLINITSRK